MENSGLEKKVGIFVVLSVIVLIAVIFALGGDKSLFKSYQTMKMHLDETSGLAAGAVVQIAGISAGNVKSIELDADTNKLTVTLKIDKKYAHRITKGTTAGVMTQGALGDKYVLLKLGPPAAEVLPDNSFVENEEGSDLLSTLGKSGTKFEKAFEIVEHVRNITRDLDEHKFAKNLSEFTRILKNTMTNVDDTLASKKLKKSLEHIASIMEKIDKGQGTLGSLINDPTIHDDLKSILGGAKRSNLLKYLIRQTVQTGEAAQKEEEDNKKKKAKEKNE